MSDVTCFLNYIEFIHEDGSKRFEPALCLKKAVPFKTPVYVIPQCDAYLCVDETTLPDICLAVANVLNMHPNKSLLMKIATLILNRYQEWLAMPPVKKLEGRECGEGKLIINDKVRHFGVTSTGQFIY